MDRGDVCKCGCWGQGDSGSWFSLKKPVFPSEEKWLLGASGHRLVILLGPNPCPHQRDCSSLASDPHPTAGRLFISCPHPGFVCSETAAPASPEGLTAAPDPHSSQWVGTGPRRWYPAQQFQPWPLAAYRSQLSLHKQPALDSFLLHFALLSLVQHTSPILAAGLCSWHLLPSMQFLNSWVLGRKRPAPQLEKF